MFQNHLKIAWRSLIKNRLVTILNIFGLAIGMAACLVILQYVGREFSYDKFYQGSDAIFRLNTQWKGENGDQRYATTPPPLAEAIRNEIPETEGVVRVFKWGDFTMRPDDDFENAFRETNIYAADEDFFKVLDYGLIKGDPETVLKDPVSIVLTKSAAIRYFGEEAWLADNIVGRDILGGKDAGTPWEVTGIMDDQPENSHFQFDYLISSNTYPEDLHRNQNWTWNIMHTYVRLNSQVVNDEAKLTSFKNKLQDIVNKHALPFMGTTPEQYAAEGNQMQYLLQPISDIHLKSDFLREMQVNGSLTYVQIFLLTAFFLILIACVNYINLFTAQSSKRAKEVGVKKVIGAKKHSLIKQFLTESFLLSSIATIIALGLVEILRVLLGGDGNAVFFKPYFDYATLFMIAFALMVIVGTLAGLYPAFYLTHFKPIEVLKGKIRSGLNDTGIRNGLVVFQFSVSIGLIAGTLIVQNQIDLFQNAQLGFEKENVLIIQNDKEIDNRIEEFKTELNRHPDVLSSSISTGIPGLSQYHMRDFRMEGDERRMGINWYEMDYSHVKTMGMEMADGRSFEKDRASDSLAIVLNQSAVQELGLDDPVGSYILKNEGSDDQQRLQVIGVLKDFHFESLHHEVKPIAIQNLKTFIFKDYITVRLAPGNPSEAVDHIKTLWKKFEPGVPLQYSFMDADYDAHFKSEVQMGSIFKSFTGLAILIACMGLFGLAAFVTEQRRKELGIRKILGASSESLFFMISKDFLKLVGIAFLIAAPIAWYFMNGWLQNFAYQISINWTIFVIAGLSVGLIAWLTISFHTFSAANGNPVKAIKHE